jgi:Cysteine sulfinate desulfinase/cysteine desulfurase and related enzymes
MIYFDYAANTPADKRVIERFADTAAKIIGNPNSLHSAGKEANAKMEEITEKIANMLGVKPSEIIYTSGASESNNFAIKGIANAKRHIGKHIITSFLEHSSVGSSIIYLQEMGYEVDMVDITKEGKIDIKHLKELIRKDTILVTVCAVDSELGVIQPIKEIADIVNQYADTALHIDATQAIGKIAYSFEYGDTISLAPHKFYGLNGCGLVIKREELIIPPLINGGASTTIFRSGTPATALADSILSALEIYLSDIESRYLYVDSLKLDLIEFFKNFENIRINSPETAFAYVINLSVEGVRAFEMQKILDEKGICISTKSACSSPKTASKPVLVVTGDKKNARCSWRLSISHMTTREEIEEFKKIFESIMKELFNGQRTGSISVN